MFKQLITCSLVVCSQLVFAIDEKDPQINALATQYAIPVDVLADFVASYNFKCPTELNAAQINWLLKDAPYDNELRIMAESEGMEYRDIYVDARSNIQCMSQGEVSRAY